MTYQLSLRFTAGIHLDARLRICSAEQKTTVALAIPSETGTVYEGTLDPVSSGSLCALIRAALRKHDASWSVGGFDGITIRGSFESPEWSLQDFDLWSPDPGSPAHWLISAALETVPMDQSNAEYRTALKVLREWVRIGTAPGVA